MNDDNLTVNHHSSSYHVPVLFEETMEALQIKPSGVYVDCTFGGGGHSKGIINKLSSEGKLIAFDQDADAAKNVPEDNRIVFVANNFRHLQRFLRVNGFAKVDGVVADLGVSSHQFDEGERGFSTRFEGPLDMRMDQRKEITASNILKTYTELQLHKLFEQYGEVTNSKTLAKQVVQQRSSSPLQTIAHLKAMIKPVVKGNPNKYLAQVFQALRIEVNDEMGALKEMLEQIPDVLKPGGRAVIITFHSLEDRLVKNFFKNGTFDERDEHSFLPQERENTLIIITKKPVVAGADEVRRNARSRSAKLRVAEKK